MGMLNEALEVCEKGVKLHPDFAGGRVALGRIYIDLKRYKDAAAELRKVTELSPDNVLAYNLLSETHLHLKQPKEALKAYKMLLFLAPDNEKAKTAVQKLESLTADEYEDDVFEMRPLEQAVKEWDQIELDFVEPDDNKKDPSQRRIRQLERFISLADAYIVRNDTDRALKVLQEAEKHLGSEPEIVKRLKLIHHRQLENIPHPKNAEDLKPAASRERRAVDEKIEFLQDLLGRFKERAKDI